MADLCEYCFKPIKNHWKESHLEDYKFCGVVCQDKWEKQREIKVSKDKIKGKGIILRIKQNKTEQPSYLFCDEIEYMHHKGEGIFDHHLMIRNNNDLIFKVWLPNNSKDKEFKDVFQAIKSVGMDVHY